jgi:hypothetical protein
MSSPLSFCMASSGTAFDVFLCTKNKCCSVCVYRISELSVYQSYVGHYPLFEVYLIFMTFRKLALLT